MMKGTAMVFGLFDTDKSIIEINDDHEILILKRQSHQQVHPCDEFLFNSPDDDDGPFDDDGEPW